MAIVSGNKGKKPGERLMQITVRGEKKKSLPNKYCAPPSKISFFLNIKKRNTTFPVIVYTVNKQLTKKIIFVCYKC